MQATALALIIAQAAFSGWQDYDDDNEHSYLFKEGRQVAVYNHRSGVYRTFDAGTGGWGPRVQLGRRPDGFLRDNGLVYERISQQGEHFNLSGSSTCKDKAIAAIGGSVPDDAKSLRLTVIGAPAELAKVRHDAATVRELQDATAGVVVQYYEPTHWHVGRAGFKADGNPTIYLLASDGKVLHRQDDYKDGPQALAEAIRKARPDYRPENDPDQRQGLFRPRVSIPEPAWLLGLAALVAFVWKRSP